MEYTVTIVNYKEERDIKQIYASDGTVIDTVPVPNSEKATLTLRFQNGETVDVAVKYDDYLNIVVPEFSS